MRKENKAIAKEIEKQDLKRKVEELEREQDRKRVMGDCVAGSSGQGKRKAEEVGDEDKLDIGELECLVTEWVEEVVDLMKVKEEEREEEEEVAWDDVNGGDLPIGLVKEARKEEAWKFVLDEKWGDSPSRRLRADFLEGG